MQSGVGYAAADTWSSSRIKHLARNFLCSSSQHVDFGTPALLTLVKAASRGSRPATLWCGEFGKHLKSGESGEIARKMRLCDLLDNWRPDHEQNTEFRAGKGAGTESQ